MTCKSAGGFWEKRSVFPPHILCADHGVLCVSHPGSKGFPTFTTFPQAGGSGFQWLTWSNEAGSLEGKWLRTLNHVPAECFTSCYPPFPLFDSWWFRMIPSRKPFFFPSSCAAILIVSQPFWVNNVQQYFSADSFALPFHHLPSHRELALTEYKCQSVLDQQPCLWLRLSKDTLTNTAQQTVCTTFYIRVLDDRALYLSTWFLRFSDPRVVWSTLP